MKAHFRYLDYVVRHKWFVLVAGLRMGAPLWRLLIHDWSKFLPSEWRAYVRFFYAPQVKSDPRGESASYNPGAGPIYFNMAWLKHQHRNPHHWQHWVLREDSGNTFALPMPESFVRDMVADWMGAGRAITGRWEVREGYEQNKGKMLLAVETRALVEALL
jgi:hypothetical protein